jgi:hypothetical protein
MNRVVTILMASLLMAPLGCSCNEQPAAGNYDSGKPPDATVVGPADATEPDDASGSAPDASAVDVDVDATTGYDAAT